MRRPSTSTVVTAIVAALVVIAFVVSLFARPWHRPVDTPPHYTAADTPSEPARPIRDEGFEDYFAPGGKVIAPGWHATVTVEDLGELRLTSGRIIAADPGYGADGLEPFTVTVAPGSYRVELSRLAIRYNGGLGEDDRVAAVRLLIADTPVTSWEMALLPGQEKGTLATGEYFGFGVDSGVASFMDADVLPALEGLAPSDATGDDPGPIYGGLDHEIGVNVTDPASGANLVAWYSGWGDGSYPVWIGRDAAGTVVQVVADMLLL